jgi:hypothetical protein
LTGGSAGCYGVSREKFSSSKPKPEPSQRKARVAAVVANAKALGKKVPRGVKLIDFREPTVAERKFSKTLVPLARKRAKAAA